MNAKDTPSNRSNTVLFAIKDEFIQEALVAAFPLYNFRYDYHFVTTLPEAHQWLSQHAPCCVVMTAEFAISSVEGSAGLVETLPPKVPTVSLLQCEKGFPEYLYAPERFRSWCTIPFDIEEVVVSIYRIVERAAEHENGT